VTADVQFNICLASNSARADGPADRGRFVDRGTLARKLPMNRLAATISPEFAQRSPGANGTVSPEERLPSDKSTARQERSGVWMARSRSLDLWVALSLSARCWLGRCC
jgi:hypothetical protein